MSTNYSFSLYITVHADQLVYLISPQNWMGLLCSNKPLFTDLWINSQFEGRKWLTIQIFIPSPIRHTLLNKAIQDMEHDYTGCHRRKGPNFGRVFLMLNYTDITQNIYIQSWTVTEIMAREVWNFDSCYSLIDYQIHIETGRNVWFL